MTVIAGIVHDGHVYMAADSSRSSGHLNMPSYEPKIMYQFSALRRTLMGVAGEARVLQLVRGYLFETCSFPDFSVDVFCEELRQLLVKSEATDHEDGQHRMSAQVLLGVEGRLYHIDCVFAPTELLTIGAIGAGGELAIGALAVTQHHKNPYRRLQQALSVAEDWCNYVRAPYLVMSDSGDMQELSKVRGK
jgi:ATP-dependent protease HslVU (ClpYQ) peptidase subunit